MLFCKAIFQLNAITTLRVSVKWKYTSKKSATTGSDLHMVTWHSTLNNAKRRPHLRPLDSKTSSDCTRAQSRCQAVGGPNHRTMHSTGQTLLDATFADYRDRYVAVTAAVEREPRSTVTLAHARLTKKTISQSRYVTRCSGNRHRSSWRPTTRFLQARDKISRLVGWWWAKQADWASSLHMHGCLFSSHRGLDYRVARTRQRTAVCFDKSERCKTSPASCARSLYNVTTRRTRRNWAHIFTIAT